MKCNRGACNTPAHPKLIHRDNGKAYCVACAREINEFAREPLIPWINLSVPEVVEALSDQPNPSI